MQTFNTVEFRAWWLERRFRKLHFVIEPAGGKRWQLAVRSLQADTWVHFASWQGELRTWRQINAVVRFIREHAGDHHRVEIRLTGVSTDS